VSFFDTSGGFVETIAVLLVWNTKGERMLWIPLAAGFVSFVDVTDIPVTSSNEGHSPKPNRALPRWSA
jgi:hypothetical protein